MRGAYAARQPRALVNVHGDHQVETQEREVVQVVLRQLLAAKVRVHGAESSEAALADARALEVGPLDTARVAHDDVLYVTFAVDERAYLPPRLVRELGELPRELGRDYLLRRDAPRVELLDAPQLVRLQALRVAVYVADKSSSASVVNGRKSETHPVACRSAGA